MGDNKVIYSRKFDGKQESRLYSEDEVLRVKDVQKFISNAVGHELTKYDVKQRSKSVNTVNTKALEYKVLKALLNDAFIGRTVRGVAQELGVPKIEIFRILNQDFVAGEKIKVFPRRNNRGEKIYTLFSTFAKRASLKDKFIDAFSSQY